MTQRCPNQLPKRRVFPNLTEDATRRNVRIHLVPGYSAVHPGEMSIWSGLG